MQDKVSDKFKRFVSQSEEPIKSKKTIIPTNSKEPSIFFLNKKYGILSKEVGCQSLGPENETDGFEEGIHLQTPHCCILWDLLSVLLVSR